MKIVIFYTSKQTHYLTELSEDRIEQIWIGRGDTWYGLFSVVFPQSNNLNELSLGGYGSFWCQTLMLHNVSFTATSLNSRWFVWMACPLPHAHPTHTHIMHTKTQWYFRPGYAYITLWKLLRHLIMKRCVECGLCLLVCDCKYRKSVYRGSGRWIGLLFCHAICKHA